MFVLLTVTLMQYSNNRQKQKANALLQQQKTKTEAAYHELKTTQNQLLQREKMASLGELTAGIAHEIQNPLNFVNNFSETNIELIEEMGQEINKGNIEEVKAIANDVKENEQKINHHGKRAEAIVKGMLEHSNRSKGEKQPTDLNVLAAEYLRLSLHGFRAKDNSFNVNFKTNFDENIGKIEVVPQDIGRVLLNLYNNAFYAINEKKQLNGTFEPTVEVSSKKVGNKVELSVKDNGAGIPEKIVDKIYQPFFTTKPTGQGTGLGLSLSYDIITKGHGGEMKVETKEGEGAEFVIQLPVPS
jgi:signal transduction histidine kinase